MQRKYRELLWHSARVVGCSACVVGVPFVEEAALKHAQSLKVGDPAKIYIGHLACKEFAGDIPFFGGETTFKHLGMMSKPSGVWNVFRTLVHTCQSDDDMCSLLRNMARSLLIRECTNHDALVLLDWGKLCPSDS